MHYVLLFSLFLTISIDAKVDPPNFNFSFNELEAFEPGSKFTPNKKNSDYQYKLIEENKDYQKYLIIVKKRRYSYKVFVQVKDNKILDFFVRLPSYFMHDTFHQSIINRYGKQSFYKKIKLTGIYRWKSKGIIRNYQASCTLTCFPIFYSVSKEKYDIKKFKSLKEQMSF